MDIKKERYQLIPLNFLNILNLTPSEALVLSKIRSLESKKFGENCITTYADIGLKWLGLTERVVSYAAKKLQEKGLIQVGIYHTPNARRSHLKTYYKKTLQPVDDALFHNGMKSVYVKIPNEIVTSTILNASNKLYYGVIAYLRSKLDIDENEPISFKHISFYLPLAKRKTVSDNIKKLQDLNIIDDLGYNIFSNEILKQENNNAPRGNTKIPPLSPEEKSYLLKFDESLHKQITPPGNLSINLSNNLSNDTNPIFQKSNTILKIHKKDIPLRPTINLDLSPKVEGISICIEGVNIDIDMRLSEKLPILLEQTNDLKLFSNKRLKSSELSRILMAIGVTFIKQHLKK